MRYVYLLMILSITLAGCSGANQSGQGTSASGTTASISGVVSAGPVNGATVTAYSLNSDGSQGSALGTTTTDASGRYSLSLSGITGPLTIVASGGSYKEEASGATINMGSAEIRTTLSTVSDGQQVGITPLTEIATQSALALIRTNSTANAKSIINNANQQVATAVGLSDITLPPADPTVAASSASSTQAAQYALVLASLSQVAKSASTSQFTSINSMDLMQSMATAFTFNGNFSAAIGGSDVPVSNGSNATVSLSTVLGGVTNFAATLQNAETSVCVTLPSGFNDPSIVPPTTFDSNPTDNNTSDVDLPETPATIPDIRPTNDGPPSLPPPPVRYAISGTVSGLVSGHTLILQDNGYDDVVVTADGSFQFGHELLNNAQFSVTISQQPLEQLCTVSGGDGSVVHADVISISVSCVSSTTIFDGLANSGYAQGISIASDSQGNIYVLGRSTPGLDGLATDAYPTDYSGVTMVITKYNSNFVRQWTVQDGVCISPSKIVIDSSGNIYATGSVCQALDGQTFHSNPGNMDMFITKYDTNGLRQWTIEDGGTSVASGWGVIPQAIALDSAGAIYVTGVTTAPLDGTTLIGTAPDGTFDSFLTKYSNSGVHQWTIVDGSAPTGSMNQTNTWGLALAVDSNNNVYVAGRSTVAIDSQTLHGLEDSYLSKYNSSGALQWTKMDGSTGTTVHPVSLAIDSGDNIYMAGYLNGAIDGQTQQSAASYNDYFISKLNSSGALQWTKQDVIGQTTLIRGMSMDSSGNIYLVGQGSNSGFLFARLNPSGARQWFVIEGGSGISGANPNGISLDLGGHIYVTGDTTQNFNGQTVIGETDLFITRF